jgi:hypothetical protein
VADSLELCPGSEAQACAKAEEQDPLSSSDIGGSA